MLASKQVVRCERTFNEIHLKGLKAGFYTDSHMAAERKYHPKKKYC